MEPAIALTTCETALRSLMTHCYAAMYGASWLDRVATDKQRASWTERAEIEAKKRTRKGVATVPDVGLSYANFFDLVDIAKKHWEPLAGALGERKVAVALLDRFDDLRNTVGHSRPLLKFERDLLSGIAGQIRNQVTLYMTDQDDAGEYYPRIESIRDSFGRGFESAAATGPIAGQGLAPYPVLIPGDHVTFECFGVDPQERDLEWTMYDSDGRGLGSVIAPSGERASLRWEVRDSDVREHVNIEIRMRAVAAKYRRFGRFDHRAAFFFNVRPPRDVFD